MLGVLRSLKNLTKGLFRSYPQEKARNDKDDELECDCGHGPNRTDLKSADDVVSFIHSHPLEKAQVAEDKKLPCMNIQPVNLSCIACVPTYTACKAILYFMCFYYPEA